MAGLGVAIGSLLPDVDGEDATIFHQSVRGTKKDVGKDLHQLIQTISAFFPYFGYPVKYLIYRPTVWIYDRILPYDVSGKHRGYTHSHLGIWTTGVLTALLFAVALILFDAFDPFFTTVFFGGLVSGMYLHILEDSCTKSGIAWNYPFSNTTLSGALTTTTKAEDVRPMQGFLVCIGIIFGSSAFLMDLYQVPVLLIVGLNFGILTILWSIFVFGVSSAGISS